MNKRSFPLADWLWFLVCGLASSLWCLTVARQLSATFDEPIYLEQGLRAWRTGSHQGLIHLGTMPLPIDVQTLPIHIWERLHHTHFDLANNLTQPLMWARAGNLVFWWLLLAYGLLNARRLGGPWAGRLAVGLLACEPNLLAHASLATTDIAVSACLLAFVYHYQTGRGKSWAGRVGLPALWLAAVVLAKASGPIFAILCMLVIEWDYCRDKPEASAFPATTRFGSLTFLRERVLWKDIGRIVGWGMLFVFIYCGCDWQPQPDLVRGAQHMSPGTGRTFLVWLAEHLRIFSNAGEGIQRQIAHNGSGHGWFLLGRSGPRAVWYYFPVALTIKLSPPLLLLPLIIALVRARYLANWACLCALLLVLLSVTYRVQIGIRYLVRPVCLAIVGLSGAVVCAAREDGREVEAVETAETGRLRTARMRARIPLVIACISILWTTVTAVQWWPNALCYTNGLWGDPRWGYLLISDSNYDWGQGLPELRQWQESHPKMPLSLWYFGHDPQSHQFSEILLHKLPIHSGADLNQYLQGHYLAVSMTVIYGGYAISREPYVVYLRSCRPMARTTTFLIYDFTATGTNPKADWPRKSP